MKFRREILWTLVIQGSGAASVLGLVVVLGAALGPSAQGLFSRTKAELEFVSALCLFGMPQAAFFFVSTGRLRGVTALRLTSVLAAVTVALAIVYGGTTGGLRGAPLIAFSIATVLMVTHGMLRVLVLSCSDTRVFNVVTVLPQLMLWPMGGALIGYGAIDPWHVSAGFALAFLAGSLAALAVICRSANSRLETGSHPVNLGELLAYGCAAWSVAALNAGAYVFCLRVIESGAGLHEVGVFTMGIVLVQGVLTPFNYAAPLLFKRWVVSRPRRKASVRIAVASAFGASMLAGSLIAIAGPMSAAGLLGSYSQLDELKWSFGAVAVVEAMIRTTASIANAHGRPWIPALGEAVRLLALVVAVGFGFVGESSQAARSWLLAASLASAVVLVGIIRVSPGATRS